MASAHPQIPLYGNHQFDFFAPYDHVLLFYPKYYQFLFQLGEAAAANQQQIEFYSKTFQDSTLSK